MHVHGVAPDTPPDLLLATLQPGDVLLVEGHSRVGTAIKYLTQSTWSHATLYVGGDRGRYLVEADIGEGVRRVGIDEYAGFHTSAARPPPNPRPMDPSPDA